MGFKYADHAGLAGLCGPQFVWGCGDLSVQGRHERTCHNAAATQDNQSRGGFVASLGF
jgi:hypothetical protein